MRLQRLQMTAIGPFRDHTELDLSRFGGLFLIEGPTGAGKSTVLDAISFALYGKPARSGASVERLKSHHAPLGTEPVVELVFETRTGRFRVRRSVPYERAKKRGTGTLPVRMTVALYRLTDPDDLDHGELISNNLGDAEDELTRILGLSHAQFVQTVLLPQGEFASFLTARTEVKRDLLQRLFGTEVIERVQAQLVEGRQAALRQRAGAGETVRAAVSAFAAVTELTPESVAELVEAAERGARQALTTALAEQLQRLAARAAESGAAATQAGRRCQSAQSRLRRATELQQRRQLRDSLRSKENLLLDRAAEHAAGQAELSAAERAVSVIGTSEGVASAQAERDRARRAELAARATLPPGLGDAPADRLRREASALATTLGSLDQELAREQQLSARRDDQLELAREQAEQTGLIVQAEAALASLPERISQAQHELAGAERAAAQLPAARAERDRAAIRLAAARQAEVAAAEAAQEQLLAQELFETAERAEQRLAGLQRQWRASIASELGLALQDGDPCSVCGSIEHPQPARPARDHVSQDQLQRAEQDLSRLRSDVERRRSQLAERQGELIRLQVAAEQLTPELAQATLSKLEAVLDELELSGGRQPGLAEELSELRRQQEQLAAVLAEARLDRARRESQLSALGVAIAHDEQGLQAARAGFESVSARIEALRADTEAVERALARIEEGRAGEAAVAKAQEMFDRTLTDAGFAGPAEWAAARRTSAEIARLRQQLRDYEQELAAVRTRLQNEELLDPELDDPPADLDELAAAAEAAEGAEQAARQQHGATVELSTRATELVTRVEQALGKVERVLAETAAAIRVGNLVAGLGDNQLRMELTTYVLVRRFAEVLLAANNQLRRISGGRYELEHTDARTGSAKSGLNLRVLDLHTGRPRDPATLSGGETFYVSLSLALGLADVVRAESGGIDLGTLFIDEGFGTLDAEVLDEVIAVLDGLRAGGRSVGIVSHVSELKSRIPDQIRVLRGVDGRATVRCTA